MSKNKLKLIHGPMFAGKTYKLIKIINYFNKKKKKIIVFKPFIDNRKKPNYIVCHNNVIYPVKIIYELNEILKEVEKTKDLYAIFFSEVQFFHENFSEIIKKLIEKKFLIFCEGLSKDFENKTFSVIEDLKSLTNKIELRHASCYKCFIKADYSKRLISVNSKILIGGRDLYIPVCEKCYQNV